MAKVARLGRIALSAHRPNLVASFTDRTPLPLLRRATKRGLAFAEARVDLFASLDAPHVERVLERVSRLLPVLLTPRAKAEGGAFAGNEAERLALYLRLLPRVAAVDVELDAPIRARVVRAARQLGRTVVLSHHDFAKTPSAARLDAVVARARRAGADVVKVATAVKDDRDVARLAALLLRHETKPLVVIGMGAHGKKTRVLFPALGSRFTFVALGAATAPGQLALSDTVAELERYYPDFRPPRAAR